MQIGQSSVQLNFANYGRPSKWDKRSPGYEGYLKAEYGYVKGVVMRLTSRLANSIGVGGQIGPEGDIQISGNRARLITRVPYAVDMQYGKPGPVYIVGRKAGIKLNGVPARPFMMWQQTDGEDVAASCSEYLTKKLRGDA